MSKIFLYIDESKDYKNNTLYLGGIVSHLGFHAFEKVCKNFLLNDFSYELKSTKPSDRELFRKILSQENIPFACFVQKLSASSDKHYIDSLIQLLSHESITGNKKHTHIHISADFIRLNTDMKKFQKAVSRKLSNHFNLPIELEFRNSSQYRCIQFADLSVGVFRRRE